ncbi:MAG TPA: ABC transporter permease [Gemmatimonadales bacterium]|nr:ABC transporter permease [Gemmatimonadales bacterium]
MAFAGLRRLFRLVVRPPAVEQEVDAELRFHLEAETEALVARGMRPDAARQEARRRFGDLGSTREVLVTIDKQRRGQERRAGWLEDLRQDFGYALRGFRRQPGFAALVVATLGLGIGANATMFGIVDRILFRPPAFLKDPALSDRVYLRYPNDEGGERVDNNISYHRYRDLVAGARTLSAGAAFFDADRIVGIGEPARELGVSLVSAGFWRMFEVRPILGRFFSEAEDQPPAGTAVAVLGYGYWQSAYGGDRSALGKSVFVGARPYTIIGVAPRGFEGLSLRQVSLFIPITAGAYDDAGDRYVDRYGFSWLEILLQRRPGVSREAADADLTLVYQQSLAAQPGAKPATVSRSRVELAPVLHDRGPEPRGEARVAIWLAGVAVVVLLIACANVANLLLARALRRRREIAVRLALGVARGRLLRQLLTESTLLTLLGGASGLLIAHYGGGVLRKALLSYVDWTVTTLFDRRILLFTAASALLTGVLTGVIPALQAGRTEVTGALKAGGREGSHRTTRLRASLLVVQAALSVMLLIGSGLFLRSLRNVGAVDLGYQPGRLLFVNTDFRGTKLSPAERNALQQRMLERARALPGVQSAAVTFGTPYWASLVEDVFVPGRGNINSLGALYLNRVSGDYFTTTGTPIVRGRALTEADRIPPAAAAVVSETMARRVWPGQEAIGQCLKQDADTMPCSQVVGIAKDVRWGSLGDEDRMQHYHPLPLDGRGRIYVRTAGDPRRQAEPLRRELQALVPGTTFVTVQPLTLTLDPVFRPWRLGATMFTLFGGLALLVAAIGLYGVIAYSVTQRLHEMGVRVALGARTGDLLRLVVGEGIRVALIGILLGAAGAFMAGKLIASLLFGVPARDPLTFGIVAAVLLLVAILASLVPAWRASRVDPNLALRAE